MPHRFAGLRTRRAASVLVLALGTALVLPAALGTGRGDPGPPATVGSKEPVEDPTAPVTRLSYRAAPGQNNRVTVTESAADYDDITYVIDDVVPIDPGNGCAYLSDVDHTKVSCKVKIEEMATDPYNTLFVELGDGEDTASGRRVGESTMGYTVFSFGSGDDTWAGTSNEVMTVYGGPGDDKLTAIRGVHVDGNAGDDTIHAGEGTSALGGPGDDTIHAEGDGASASGGPGDDVLRGREGDQVLSGEQGDDSIHGGPGDDLLSGNEGNDVLYGDDGDDLMWGERKVGDGFELSRDEKLGKKRDDKLYGGPGTDELYGGPGPDGLYGGPGTDRLDGGTSPNTVVQD
ncbi:calcium-binding protein [Streptomyces ferrugineus]|uniref:Calcium-binding protein n=1 Tax=Streptomyces ferrugineus TaxID=1413221 RepID=A0A7M2SP74_9ACTN|nr:calcium-binding protein [Streptomyces ferrugineus]QOV37809.1 calcium-binding protein [Streptomyces ferrugineus]